MSRPLTTIPPEHRAAMLHKLVHVTGWPAGCVFRLEALDGDRAKVITPKSGRRYVVAANRLAYTRLREPTGGTS